MRVQRALDERYYPNLENLQLTVLLTVSVLQVHC